MYIWQGGTMQLFAPLYTGPYKLLAPRAKFFKLRLLATKRHQNGQHEALSSADSCGVDSLKPLNHFSWHACLAFCKPKAEKAGFNVWGALFLPTCSNWTTCNIIMAQLYPCRNLCADMNKSGKSYLHLPSKVE
jgi:hypothetical protein